MGCGVWKPVGEILDFMCSSVFVHVCLCLWKTEDIFCWGVECGGIIESSRPSAVADETVEAASCATAFTSVGAISKLEVLGIFCCKITVKCAGISIRLDVLYTAPLLTCLASHERTHASNLLAQDTSVRGCKVSLFTDWLGLGHPVHRDPRSRQRRVDECRCAGLRAG